MKKLLYVIPTLNSGGAEKMLVDIVKQLKNDMLCEIAVLSSRDAFFLGELEKLNIPIYLSEAKSVYSSKNIFFLRKILKNNRYDIVHTHLFSAQLFVPIAMSLISKKMPLVTTEHSTHNKRRDNKKFYLIDKWMYSKYDKIIAISQETKVNLSDYIFETEQKTIVVENGINLDQYYSAKAILKHEISSELQPTDKIILMVAGMREQKDPETLIRASKLLPGDYKIVFVGDGERMEEVKRYANDKDAKSVIFIGKRQDIPEIMKTSDVFVLSSRWEGFGLVIIEAAAAGLPIIASNVPGLSGVVSNIEGMLFEPFNEIDLAEKIIFAYKNRLRKYDLSKYSIDFTIKSYIKIYNELLKS